MTMRIVVEGVNGRRSGRRRKPVGATGPRPRALTVDAEKPGLMVCLDRALRIQQANREFFRWFGLAPTEVCDLGFGELVHPSLRQAVLLQLTGLLEGKRHRARGPGARWRGRSGGADRDGGARRPGCTAVLVLMRPATGGPEATLVTGGRMLLSEVDARILEGIAAGCT